MPGPDIYPRRENSFRKAIVAARRQAAEERRERMEQKVVSSEQRTTPAIDQAPDQATDGDVAPLQPPTCPHHGVGCLTAYNRGCRCDTCRAARAEWYQRSKR
jgi:hypothetical protein